MTPKQFLAKLDPDRKVLLTALHNAILHHDKKVVAKVQTMMRQEMIGYCEDGIFKYALSPVKSYMSLLACTRNTMHCCQKQNSRRDV